MNSEIGQATTLKLRARGIIRSFVLPHALKKEILQGIEDIFMPLFKYIHASNNEVKRSFIAQVMGGIGNKVTDKIKTSIKSELEKGL